MLQGERDVAELLEDGGEDEGAAGEQVAGALLGGPAVHGLGDPAGRRDVAAPAQQVATDQPGAQLQLGAAELAGGLGGALGALLDPLALEPGQRLQPVEGSRQRHGGRVVRR